MESNYQDVLDYWFNGKQLGREQRSRWWQKKMMVDQEIKHRFSGLVAEIYEGLHEHWSQSPQGRLAAIICLDQFPRSIYRDSGKAFSFDEKALYLTLEGLKKGDQMALTPLEKTFFMMPLLHDESLDSQDRCVEYYEQAVVNAEGEMGGYLSGVLDFARRHRDIIERFGRFPHRNKLLGRKNTVDEDVFLTQSDKALN